MFGFGSLRFRASARKHASASTLPRLGGKAASCILGFVGIPAMNPPLITAEQRVQLLAVGEARAAGQSIDQRIAVDDMDMVVEIDRRVAVREDRKSTRLNSSH